MNDSLVDQQWLHVDINSYFATLVQQEVPSLRGRPVGVVKDVGRTCIIAASKEAKQLGIGVGTRLAEAKILCPDLVIMPCDFDQYLSATRNLKQILDHISPDVEIFSLDESFIHFLPLKRQYNSAVLLAQLIQSQIRQVLGEWVTCNVGIARTRLLAKMSGETTPKGSVSWVHLPDEAALLARTKFKDVCGVGLRLENKLARMNITVPYQINFVDQQQLESLVGVFWLKELNKMAMGDDPLFLTRINDYQHQAMKSIGRSITGYQLWSNTLEIKRIIYNLTAEVVYKARSQQLLPRQVSIRLIGRDQAWGDFQTFRHHVFHTQEVFNLIWQMVLQAWQPFPVIKIAVRLSLLESWQKVVPPLWPEWRRRERLELAINAVTQKFGLHTLQPGLQLGIAPIMPEVTGFFGDKGYYLGGSR